MTKHLNGNRFMMLCDLLTIKQIGGRPSPAPKLTLDTEYISRASRAQGAMTLSRQAAASEITVPSGAEHETWIDGFRADFLDDSWVDNRCHHDLLHPHGPGTAMVEMWKSR